jgi:thioesterase domain-containing protein
LAVQLISQIEKRFERSLPVAVLFQSPTIEQLARLLEKDKWPRSWSRVIHIQPQGSRIPFFWVHSDSSNAALAAYLGSDQPLYGVEHQGHDGQPALYREVGTIAKHYIDELRKVQPQGPYLLGGFSFGAVVAFEMASLLKRHGEQVDLLFMLDPTGKASDKKMLESPRALTTRLQRKLRRLRWTSYVAAGKLLPPSLRSPYILNIYREALRSYVPMRYTGRVVILKTSGAYEPPLNWPELIDGDLEIHETAGGHMDLRREPHVGPWAKQLKTWLERAARPTA